MIKLDITPVPKPRQTQSDKWKKRPPVLRYRAFADEVRLKMPKDYDMNYKRVTFYMPMPKSWTKKKREEMDMHGHQQKPDVDNLCKALLDAMYADDSYVFSISVLKLWAEKGAIHIG